MEKTNKREKKKQLLPVGFYRGSKITTGPKNHAGCQGSDRQVDGVFAGWTASNVVATAQQIADLSWELWGPSASIAPKASGEGRDAWGGAKGRKHQGRKGCVIVFFLGREVQNGGWVGGSEFGLKPGCWIGNMTAKCAKRQEERDATHTPSMGKRDSHFPSILAAATVKPLPMPKVASESVLGVVWPAQALMDGVVATLSG